MPDAEFLHRLIWSTAADSELTARAAAGKLDRFAATWSRGVPKAWKWRSSDDVSRLGGDRRVVVIAEETLFRGFIAASIPFAPDLVDIATRWDELPPGEEVERPRSAQRGDHGDRKEKRRSAKDARRAVDAELSAWLEQRCHDAAREPSPVDLLVLCDLLLFARPELSSRTIGHAWRAVASGVEALRDVMLNPAEGASSAVRAALCGELPWKAGLLLRGLDSADALRDAGRAELRDRLSSLSGAAGRPLPALVERFGVEFGPLTRAAAWGALFDVPLFDEALSQRFAAVVRSAIALCRPDGHVALATPDSSSDATTEATPGDIASLDLAAAVAGLRKKSRPRSLLAALNKDAEGDDSDDSKKERKSARLHDAPTAKRPSFQSDDTTVACLRTSWSPLSDLIAVRHDAAWPRLDLCARGRRLFDGPWELDVRRDGQPLVLTNAWKSTCWFTDDDADYLEIQQILPDGTQIERQVLLSRGGRFAVLADCVSRVGEASLELRSRLPFASDVKSHNETATRECWLESDLVAARVFPVALDDDRLRKANGSLVATDSALELRQTGVGGLFAPLVIDWHPDRANAPADWRMLTVCENGKAVPRSVASGHRCRVGEHQVLVYRSLLRNDELRTVLGHHTPHETVVALFDRDGDVHPLVLVE